MRFGLGWLGGCLVGRKLVALEIVERVQAGLFLDSLHNIGSTGGTGLLLHEPALQTIRMKDMSAARKLLGALVDAHLVATDDANVACVVQFGGCGEGVKFLVHEMGETAVACEKENFFAEVLAGHVYLTEDIDG